MAWLQKLKQRQWIFLIVAVVGVLPIVYSFGFAYVPAIERLTKLTEQLDQLKTVQATLEKQQVPVPFDTQMAAEWLMKVPLAAQNDELMQVFIEVEAGSGAKIESISWDRQEGRSASGMEQSLQELLNTQTDLSEPSAEASDNGIAIQSLTLKVAGTYNQAVAFWQQLSAMNRLVSIRSWILTPTIGESESNGTMLVQLELDVDVYTSPGFALLQ